MRIIMMYFVLSIALSACGLTTYSFDQEMWARGAESNGTSDCTTKTCFGY